MRWNSYKISCDFPDVYSSHNVVSLDWFGMVQRLEELGCIDIMSWADQGEESMLSLRRCHRTVEPSMTAGSSRGYKSRQGKEPSRGEILTPQFFLLLPSIPFGKATLAQKKSFWLSKAKITGKSRFPIVLKFTRSGDVDL